MPAILRRHRIWRQLVLSAALLAVAAPAVQAGPTTPADIDDVPRLRALLDGQAEAAPAPTAPTRSTGFDWDDAAIGAGAAAGLLIVGGLTGTAVSRLRPQVR